MRQTSSYISSSGDLASSAPISHRIIAFFWMIMNLFSVFAKTLFNPDVPDALGQRTSNRINGFGSTSVSTTGRRKPPTSSTTRKRTNNIKGMGDIKKQPSCAPSG